MDMSVIVPCHNLGAYIEPLLWSFRNQQLDKYEVEFIFVLDACSDDTRQRLEEHQKMRYMTNMELIEANVHSCGLARNEGLKIAKGNYIWFVDGDDWIIGTNTIKVLLDSLYADTTLAKLTFGVASNYYLEDFKATAWRHIFKKEFLDRYHISFTSVHPGEDTIFNYAVDKVIDMGISEYKRAETETKLYFYNFNRPDSIMTEYRQDLKERGLEWKPDMQVQN